LSVAEVQFVPPPRVPLYHDAFDIQLDAQGRLKHLLTIEGLSWGLVTQLLDTAESFISSRDGSLRKVPLLRGHTVVNLFFEASTRTRTTFELAAKRLSADVVNLNASTSATQKGETLLDTLHNLEAMGADLFVIRHEEAGAAHFMARHCAPHVRVPNAGDGRHAHPTQALLDALTIRREKGRDMGEEAGNAIFPRLCVAIVGDIQHSRVARSLIHVLNVLGVGELRLVAPTTLLPVAAEGLGAHLFTNLRAGLKDADVIVMLRLQRERMEAGLLPSEGEYHRLYGLTAERLAWARPDCMVMHPGPANRGVEIDSDVADGPQSVILKQVQYGIAVRMAAMSICMGNRALEEGSMEGRA